MLDSAFFAALDGTVFKDVRWYPEVDSTNRMLIEEARAGAAHGTVRMTDFQTAGRGRRQREWITDRGTALLASVLLRPEVDSSEAFRLTASAALGIASACATRGLTVRLKWPNDVIIGERKVAGILSESIVDSGRLDAVVIGFGVNVNGSVPESLNDRAATLEEISGETFDRARFAADVLLELNNCLSAPEGVMNRYRAQCATLGRKVEIRTASEVITGLARTVDDAGLLGVESSGGLRRFAVGDVVHAGTGG